MPELSRTEQSAHFVLTHARLLERQRMDVPLTGASSARVLRSHDTYQNADGGFGHALEPDVRGPSSETTSTLAGLELLADREALDGSAAERALAWMRTVARPDGGIAFVLSAQCDLAESSLDAAG